MIHPGATLADIAFAVCTALDRAGVVAVLTGGSAATYYAPEAYQSRDLDFVVALHGTGGGTALAGLGFEQRHQVYWHADTAFTLDFPPGPLAVGDETLTRWRDDRRGDQVLHVLTPTDSCRDRLASFLFWNDFSGLEQALAVARAQRSDIALDVIERWCRDEGHPSKYELFQSRLG